LKLLSDHSTEPCLDDDDDGDDDDDENENGNTFT
jgi:hypothetical protein